MGLHIIDLQVGFIDLYLVVYTESIII